MSAQLMPQEVDEFLVSPNKVDLKKKFEEIVVTTQSMCVTTDEQFRHCTSLYSESKDWEKRIEFLRKQANGPDQDRINARNDKAKEFLTPLKQIQSLSKQKCDEYQRFLETKNEELTEKMNRLSDLLGLEDAVYAPEPQKSIRGEGAILYTKTIQKFRVVDLDKVPLKYLQVNEEAIQRDIKLGIAEIPGVEIYQENVTQLRSR